VTVELLDEPERRTSLGRAARRWAEEHLDLDSRVRSYEALYSSLAEDGGHLESVLRLRPAP